MTGEIPITDFSSSAAAAARWTQETIAEETMAYLKGLEPADPTREPALYHASPRDPVWEYVLSTWQADECMDLMDGAGGAPSGTRTWRSGSTATSPARSPGPPRRPALERDLSSGDWLVNPGGVGQPRDGDPRAAWLLLDTDTWKATWRRVEYPIDEAARAIEEAGLPQDPRGAPLQRTVTTLKRISLLLALGACLAAAGCGSDDEEGEPIPADTAAALERRARRACRTPRRRQRGRLQGHPRGHARPNRPRAAS